MAVSRTATFGRRSAPQPAPAPIRTRSETPPSPLRPQPVAPPSLLSRLLGRIPWFTLVLSYVLITRFNAELAAATDWSGPRAPGHFTLLAMGASSRELVVGHGEWWRLFTASVLHGSPAHLSGNLVTFVVVGFLLEPMIGIGWYAAIYFTGGFAGALLSTLLNPPSVLGVGASGAIMATLAALFTLSFHTGARRPRLMRRVAGLSLFPALVPSVGHGGPVMDINAHLGGCMAGAAIGFALLILWHEEDEQPPLRSLAAIAAAFWLALTVWAFAVASTSYRRYARDGFDYIPPGAMPRSIADMKAESFSLVEKYPKDPRAHMFRGLYFLEENDVADAEPYFRQAVTLGESGHVMTPAFTRWNKALLALTVAQMGRLAEAQDMAAPLCAQDDLDQRTRATLAAARLCLG